MRVMLSAASAFFLMTLSPHGLESVLGQQANPAAAGQAEALAPPTELKSFEQKAGYAIGYDFGRSLSSQAAPVDVSATARGLVDGLLGKEAALSEEIAAAVVERFSSIMAQKAGREFLKRNQTQPGIQVTESGLQYQVLEAGKGPAPAATDRVKVHYQGNLLDGTVFDSSYARGEPAVFGVNQVIAGWTEALQRMPTGSKWRLFIPSELAYGERGTPGGPIGPNQVLVFEVELLEIVPQ